MKSFHRLKQILVFFAVVITYEEGHLLCWVLGKQCKMRMHMHERHWMVVILVTVKDSFLWKLVDSIQNSKIHFHMQSRSLKVRERNALFFTGHSAKHLLFDIWPLPKPTLGGTCPGPAS